MLRIMILLRVFPKPISGSDIQQHICCNSESGEKTKGCDSLLKVNLQCLVQNRAMLLDQVKEARVAMLVKFEKDMRNGNEHGGRI